MKERTILFIGLLITLGIVVYKLVDFNEHELSEYDKELVNYFSEVALSAEFHDNSDRIVKWTEPMSLYIWKDGEFNRQVSIIRNTINKINNLIKGEFKIQLVDNYLKSNAVIFLLEKDEVELLVPSLFEGIEEESSGLALIEYDLDNYEIKHAKIFIDINEPLQAQESIILEELTQSIGLMNDSEKYSNSIFYQNKALDSINTLEYSQMDMNIIKMLYHPKMKPGLNLKKAEKVIKQILKNKKRFTTQPKPNANSRAKP